MQEWLKKVSDLTFRSFVMSACAGVAEMSSKVPGLAFQGRGVPSSLLKCWLFHTTH